MKQAYVSIVTSSDDHQAIVKLDQTISATCKFHELVLVKTFVGQDRSGLLNDLAALRYSGPITVVWVSEHSTREQRFAAALSQAAGDFVVEWRGQLADLTVEVTQQALDPTDHGTELVLLTTSGDSLLTRAFYRLANTFRPKYAPLVRTVGRVYSRRALSRSLVQFDHDEHLAVSTANAGIPATTNAPIASSRVRSSSMPQRVAEGFRILVHGTQFATAAPLVLAAVFALFGLAAAAYAFAVYIFRQATPEGWTTLMVQIGISQAALLTLIGIIWSRIARLTIQQSIQSRDVVDISVIAPVEKD